MITYFTHNDKKSIQTNVKQILKKGYIVHTNKHSGNKPYVGSVKKNKFRVYKKKYAKNLLTLEFFGQIYQDKNINKGKVYIKGFFFIRPLQAFIYIGMILINIITYFIIKSVLTGFIAIAWYTVVFFWPLILLYQWINTQTQKKELIDFLRKISDKYV